MEQGWAKTVPAAEYYGVSVRTFREMLKRDFPHVRLDSGTILINLEKGNQYLLKRSSKREAERLGNVADEILRELT